MLGVGRVPCLNTPMPSSCPPFIHGRGSDRGYIGLIAQKRKLNYIIPSFFTKTTRAVEEK